MSQMIEVKTAELIGPALDWAVAQALDWKEPHYGVGAIQYIAQDKFLLMETPDPHEPDDVTQPHHFNHYEQWSPSRIWSQGGPLLAKYFRIIAGVVPSLDMWPDEPADLLSWAMRKIVDFELGDVVSVPAELVGGEK